jgi:hypothetical protein
MWIDIPNRELASAVATKLIAALQGNDSDPNTIDWSCVYLARYCTHAHLSAFKK